MQWHSFLICLEYFWALQHIHNFEGQNIFRFQNDKEWGRKKWRATMERRWNTPKHRWLLYVLCNGFFKLQLLTNIGSIWGKALYIIVFGDKTWQSYLYEIADVTWNLLHTFHCVSVKFLLPITIFLFLPKNNNFKILLLQIWWLKNMWGDDKHLFWIVTINCNKGIVEFQ